MHHERFHYVSVIAQDITNQCTFQLQIKYYICSKIKYLLMVSLHEMHITRQIIDMTTIKACVVRILWKTCIPNLAWMGEDALKNRCASSSKSLPRTSPSRILEASQIGTIVILASGSLIIPLLAFAESHTKNLAFQWTVAFKAFREPIHQSNAGSRIFAI